VRPAGSAAHCPAEALRIGLVTRIAADPHAEALALARTIAGHSPQAVRAAKRLCNEAPLRITEAAQATFNDPGAHPERKRMLAGGGKYP